MKKRTDELGQIHPVCPGADREARERVGERPRQQAQGRVVQGQEQRGGDDSRPAGRSEKWTS